MSRLCALISLTFFTATAPAQDRGLIELKAPGYRVITSQGKEGGLHYLKQMDRFRQALETALNKPAVPRGMEMRMFVLSAADYKTYFEPYPDIGGFFAPAEFVNYLVVNGELDKAAAMQGSFHEYAHYFLSTRYEGINYPAWFHEGFAEVMQGATFDRSSVTFALPTARILKLREVEWLPFERVLATDADTSHYSSERHRLHAFYGQSWAVMHYAINTEGVWQQLNRYVTAVDDGQPVERALRANLGVGFEGLEARIKEYVKRRKLPVLTVDLPARAPLQIQPIRTLDEDEAALSLAEAALRLLFLKGSDKARHVQPLIDRVATDSPLYPRALALRALMAGAVGDDTQADVWIKQADAVLQPGDAATAKILGNILLYRIMWIGISDRTPWGTVGNTLKRSRVYYQMAMAAQPDDLEAVWGFGMASGWANVEVELAVKLLKAAQAREPRSEYLALALGYCYDQLHQEDAAEASWRQAERYARHNSIRNIARKKLRQQDAADQGLPASGASSPLE